MTGAATKEADIAYIGQVELAYSRCRERPVNANRCRSETVELVDVFTLSGFLGSERDRGQTGTARVALPGAFESEQDAGRTGTVELILRGFLGSERDIGQAGTGGLIVPGILGSERDDGQTGAARITLPGALASEEDPGQIGIGGLIIPGSLAREQDIGKGAFTRAPGSMGGELDIGRAGTGELTRPGLLASERDEGQTGTGALILPGTLASEHDRGHMGVGGLTLPGALASEEDLGQAGAFILPGALAEERDLGQTGRGALILPGALAEERDLGQMGAGGLTRGGDTAVHIDASRRGLVGLGGNVGKEIDRGGGGTTVWSGGRAEEIQAGSLGIWDMAWPVAARAQPLVTVEPVWQVRSNILASSAAVVEQILAKHDAYTRQDQPNSNFNGQDLIFKERTLVPGGDLWDVWVAWDMTPFAGWTATGTPQIVFQTKSGTSRSGVSIELYTGATQPFSEFTITWNTRPIGYGSLQEVVNATFPDSTLGGVTWAIPFALATLQAAQGGWLLLHLIVDPAASVPVQRVMYSRDTATQADYFPYLSVNLTQ